MSFINRVTLNKGIITSTNSRIFAQTNAITELARMSDVTSEASTRASADTNLQNQVNSLNTSVSNGKSLVANAITGKGVATSSSDTFATMANNISSISSAGKYASQLVSNITTYAGTSDDRWFVGSLTQISGPTTVWFERSWSRPITMQTSNGVIYLSLYDVAIQSGGVYIDLNTDAITITIKNGVMPDNFSFAFDQTAKTLTFTFSLTGSGYSNKYWDQAYTDQSVKSLVYRWDNCGITFTAFLPSQYYTYYF